VLFKKDPAAFWRVYQIGWPSGDYEVDRDVEGTHDEASSVPATEFGTAMHALLERIDPKNPAGSLNPKALDKHFSRFGEEAVEQAGTLLKDFLKSPVFKALTKARRIEREIGFVLNGRHGLIHGKIDMLYEDTDGVWHVLDYKTAVGDRAAVQKSGYDIQIKIYALAAERILKKRVGSGILYYLKNQNAVVENFPVELKTNHDYFDGLEKEISDFQKQILDDSNQKLERLSSNG